MPDTDLRDAISNHVFRDREHRASVDRGARTMLAHRPELDPDEPCFVAGHGGLVGSALVRALTSAGHHNLVLRSRDEVDLLDAAAVDALFDCAQPRYAIVAAGRVGGIHAHATQPVEFLTENLRIELNLIESAHRHGVERLLFLGSSCVYPRVARQPLRESALLSGPLEPSNESYAIAKIAGIRLCDAFAEQHGVSFFSAMSTNLYGPGDNFDTRTSHVLPALLRRFHEAVERGDDHVDVWGTGKAMREFLYVDDLADAALHLLRCHPGGGGLYNIGTGSDLTVAALARTIAGVTGFRGEIRFDPDRPDGTPRKVLDVSRMRALGWEAKTNLLDGIERTYSWYLEQAGAPA
jgi:GDP-L-fucose synthase